MDSQLFFGKHHRHSHERSPAYQLCVDYNLQGRKYLFVGKSSLPPTLFSSAPSRGTKLIFSFHSNLWFRFSQCINSLSEVHGGKHWTTHDLFNCSTALKWKQKTSVIPPLTTNCAAKCILCGDTNFARNRAGAVLQGWILATLLQSQVPNPSAASQAALPHFEGTHSHMCYSPCTNRSVFSTLELLKRILKVSLGGFCLNKAVCESPRVLWGSLSPWSRFISFIVPGSRCGFGTGGDEKPIPKIQVPEIKVPKSCLAGWTNLSGAKEATPHLTQSINTARASGSRGSRV